MFAGNLGVYYVPMPYSNGTFGLRLTAAPLPGSPASQLPLDAGDVIFALNGQRFSSPNDVVNYSGQAAVSFVDVATNTQQSGNVTLSPVAAPAPGISRPAPSGASAPLGTSANPADGIAQAPESAVVSAGGNQIGQPVLTTGGSTAGQPAITQASPKPVLARNLGVYYLPVRYSDGTFGLKLTATPLAGSPAAQLPLDAGDVIFALDGGRFKDTGDVASHFDQTTIEYIDVSMNTRQTGTINLPPQNP
jgi:membrane-associated protease RseP (regulator of RpoE activity)